MNNVEEIKKNDETVDIILKAFEILKSKGIGVECCTYKGKNVTPKSNRYYLCHECEYIDRLTEEEFLVIFQALSCYE